MRAQTQKPEKAPSKRTLARYPAYPEFIPHDEDDLGTADHYVPSVDGVFGECLSETESLERSVAFLAEQH